MFQSTNRKELLSMGIELNKMNISLNADAIFEKLDSKDGNSDRKIEASIWNKFAEVTGGNTIKEYIEEPNAMKSINTYLKRGGEAVQKKIAEFFGWDSKEKAQATVNDAEDLLQQCAENPVLLKYEKQEYRDGSVTKKAILPDGRRISATFSKEGEITAISINTDVKKQLEYKGNNYSDLNEVRYEKENMSVSLETGNYDNIKHGSSDYYSVNASGGDYDFEKYKALAEKIFANDGPAELLTNDQ